MGIRFGPALLLICLSIPGVGGAIALAQLEPAERLSELEQETDERKADEEALPA